MDMEKDYLMINKSTNIVDNISMWNGDPNTWLPPSEYLMLIQADVIAMLWSPIIVDNKITEYELVENLGAGQIGFTWNGSVLTTDEPKPVITETLG